MLLINLAVAAVCISAPVDGPVTFGYAPIGDYGGHWGVDFSAEPNSPVMAPADGVVTFAGSVAGMRTVTIEATPGLKVSVSYLSAVEVAAGARVIQGQRVGSSGMPHGIAGVHMSVRLAGRYVDPVRFLGCRTTDITRALRLVEPPMPYPRRRANRHPRWDLRPHPHRPPARR